MNAENASGGVFVIMPFEKPHSDDLWRVLTEVCKRRGIPISRADHNPLPGLIITDILRAIDEARIVIADLTGMNHNVLYEVGLAHARCSIVRVILIRQEDDPLPFNLQAMRYMRYDLSSGLDAFCENLGKTLDVMVSAVPPTIIDSPLERTRVIASDLKLLEALPDHEVRGNTVWFMGGLSAFAIDPDETFAAEEHRNALLEEKNCLLRLARKGCTIRCIISPPSRGFERPHKPERTIGRIRCLLKFLTGRDQALEQIDWALSPFRQKNLYIIGNISCLEGYRRGAARGFALNLRQTSTDAVCTNIALCEKLFEYLASSTLSKYGSEASALDRRAQLREAAVKCLEESLRFCLSLKPHHWWCPFNLRRLLPRLARG